MSVSSQIPANLFLLRRDSAPDEAQGEAFGPELMPKGYPDRKVAGASLTSFPPGSSSYLLVLKFSDLGSSLGQRCR